MQDATSIGFLLCLATLVLRCYLGGSGKHSLGADKSQRTGAVVGAGVGMRNGNGGNGTGELPKTSLKAAVAAPPSQPPATLAPVEADPYAHTKPADAHSKVETRGGLLIPSFDIPSAKTSDNGAPPVRAPVTVPAALLIPAARASDAGGHSVWGSIGEMTSSSSSGSESAKREPSVQDWQDIARKLTFQAEPAARHGAQVMVHTLLATDVVLRESDVSWVTQLTPDRLNLFTQMLQRWQGPASATLYVHNLEEALKLVYPLRKRVDFHLVLADLHPGRLYPVNTLRNVAINKCRTHWMALVDADFIPNADLYAQLVHFVSALNGTGDSEVYVLPAFQLQKSKGGRTVPETKDELLKMGEKVSQVHPEKGRDIAHSPTDYLQWRTATSPYTVQYRMPYEPYYVANKRIPRYDVNFLGYGNDKTGQCYEVWKAGIKYKVLHFAFVFHMDHPRGDWLKSDVEWTIRGPQTLDTFFNDIDKRYVAEKKKEEEVAITAVATVAGENCTAACEREGLGCWGSKGAVVNTCKAMVQAFGKDCDGCSDMFFGHDLPAFNGGLKKCLLNQKPDEYSLSCAAFTPSSKRLCPCGEAIGQWLNDAWVHQLKTRHNLYGGRP